MENLMTLRGVRTWLLAAALGAACGGGDPHGGGNGDTDGGDETDGTTGNGDRADGHVPNPNNPLIDVIPGTWELVGGSIDGNPATIEDLGGPMRGVVRVNRAWQTCGTSPPPGDACIEDWIQPAAQILIIEGDTVRSDAGSLHIHGRILDNGWRITYTGRTDGVATEAQSDFRKLD